MVTLRLLPLEQRTVVLKFAQLFKVIRELLPFGVTNTLPEIGLTLNGQEEIVTNLNNPNHRMYDEFVVFEKMIATMDFESVVKQLKHSRQVMEVLDQASKVL